MQGWTLPTTVTVGGKPYAVHTDYRDILDIIDHLPSDGEPSMRQDGKNHRKSEVELFSGTIRRLAAKHGIPNTAKLPIDPAIAAACDAGKIEDVQGDWLSSLANAIEGK